MWSLQAPCPQNQLMRELTAMGVEPTEENGSGVFMTGVGLNAPEAVELSWAVDDEELFLRVVLIDSGLATVWTHRCHGWATGHWFWQWPNI